MASPGTGIPMGLVPAGTANLLARNLGLPLDETAAIEVAFSGHTRTIDLIKLTVDDQEPEHFAVIAGIGVDAMIMDETDPDLKAKVGTAAYCPRRGQGAGSTPCPHDHPARRSAPVPSARDDVRRRQRR